jgi:ankyrin repeat protein
LLLSRRADPDRRDRKGQTPLSGVAIKGLIEIAEALTAAGATVDAPAFDGRTPLMMAAAVNRVTMVRWLLDRGASTEARDDAGLRAVDIARAMGAHEAVAALAD